jgi:hypothetical protein
MKQKCACGKGPLRYTLSFTPAEKSRIERAAKICRWKASDSALFARQSLLRNVAHILRSTPHEQPSRRRTFAAKPVRR